MIGTGALTGANQYAGTWNNPAAGAYALSAIATDDDGVTSTSGSVGITINASPAISLTSPVNGATFAPASDITLTAAASDSDGSISKVDFYADGTLIGTATAAPFNYIWSGVPSGHYSLAAVATDDRGAATTSSPIIVAVSDSRATISGKITQSNSTAMIAGASVSVYSGTAALGSATSDSAGNYIIAGLNPGTVTVEASADGYETQTQAGLTIAEGTTLINLSLASIRPEISDISPMVGGAGAAVVITGSNFANTATNNEVLFNGTHAVANSATTTTITASVPSGATSGQVSVTTPSGTSTSSIDFYVPPPPFTAADVEVSGRMIVEASRVVTISAANKVGMALFSGNAGRRSSVRGTNASLGCWSLRVFRPDGTLLMSGDSCGGDMFIEPQLLPTSGTYALLVDPWGANTGQVNVSLYDTSDTSGAISVDGPAATVTTTTPGQNARLTFEGTTGQSMSVKADGATFGCWSLRLLKPDGTQLAGNDSCGGGAFIEPQTLPVSGTYTLVIDPWGTGTGQVSMNLYNVVHVSGTITTDGPVVNVTTTKPGQNGYLTFDATSGQRLSVKGSGATFGCWSVRVIKPGGVQLVSGDSCGGGAFIEPQVLPATGTYTLVIDPWSANTGQVNISLYDVTDFTGTIIVGGSPVTATTTAPGQNARLSFSGLAGRRVSTRVTNATFGCWSVSLLKPDGTRLANSDSCGGGAFIEPQALPGDGTYTLIINPWDANTGQATASLFDVIDATGTLTVGGASVGVTTTTPGQNANLTFDGTTGQQVTVRLTNSTVGCARVTLLKPDGTSLASMFSCDSNFNLGTQALPAPGTYTVIIDPSDANTGSFSVNVTVP